MAVDTDARIKAVVFDLDDTLYPEKEYVRSGYHAVSDLLTNIYDIESKLWKAFVNGKPAIDTVLEEEGIYSDELKKRCMMQYRFHKPDIHLYTGIEELLIKLQNKEIKIGIITDGRPEGQRAKINSLDLEHLVNNIIITDELGGIDFRKPNELAFRLMKAKFNVTFQEMVYIGDNQRKDFIAPLKLGMKAWWLRNEDGLFYSSQPLQNDKIQIVNNINDLIQRCYKLMDD